MTSPEDTAQYLKCSDSEGFVQVIGTGLDGGSNLAVPISYSFSGKAVGAELSLFLQHAEYRANHQRRRAAAAAVMGEPQPSALPAAEELTVSCGASAAVEPNERVFVVVECCEFQSGKRL